MVGFSKAQIKLVMFVEIVQRPKWVDAMKKMRFRFEKNNTWVLGFRMTYLLARKPSP